VTDSTGSSGENFVTQALNVGIEVFSAVMSFLTFGALQIHSELPGGEKVGRTSFSQAIASIFGNDDDERTGDGASPGTADG
jgi:hypothetical protein